MGEAKGHLLFFPYPLQGHINPMMQLSKRLAKKGFTVSLLIASNTHREPYTSDDYSITVHTITTVSFHTNTLSPRLKILYVSTSLPLVVSRFYL
ncbi:hypothetical protein N665_0104s0004 [Sinapis alba]|nr:hypothetical protein N665_0104s0004 [Sinapis alba]